MRPSLIATLLLISSLLPGLCRGALRASDHMGKRVVEVVVEGKGLSAAGFSRTEALGYLVVRPGDRFSRQAVRRSVKLLYHLGLFGQIQVFAQAVPGGLALTFHLAPKSRVLSVDYLGCSALSEDSLQRRNQLPRGGEYDHWKMQASTVDMLELYRSSGYRRARIVSKAQEEGDDVQVKYFIQEGQPTRIARIEFSGPMVFSHHRLRSELGLARGDILSVKGLDKALKNLQQFYSSEGYWEARIRKPILSTSQTLMREEVLIRIEPGPRIAFHFEGNQVVSRTVLEDSLRLEAGVPLNRYALDDLREMISLLYQKRGYARVRVESGLIFDSQRQRKDILFRIDEGPQVAVKALVFEGNQAFGDKQLRAYIHDAMIETIVQSGLAQEVDRGDLDQLGGGHPIRGKPRRVRRPQGFFYDLVPETIYLARPYRRALEAIEDLYLSQGFLDVRVGQPILSYDASGANLYITIPIKEGPQTKVDSISFGGNQALPAEDLLAVADQLRRFVKPGGPLDQYGVEELRKAVARAHASRGYLFCRVEQQVQISADRKLAEVHYSIVEGPQVKVGRVIVRGNLLTDQRVFDSVVTLKPGEIYTPEAAADSQSGLQALGVFVGTDIKVIDPDVVGDMKDVVVQVRERMPHHLELGPGISSAEGVRMSLGYIHTNLFGYALESVNRAKVNYQVFYTTPLVDDELQERYEEMSFFQGLEWRLMSGLHWPRMWWLGRDLSGRLDLIGLRKHARTYDLTKVSVTPGVDFKLDSHLAFTLEYEVEFIDLTCPFREEGEPCGGSTADRWVRYDEGQLVIGSFRPSLSWDLRDNPFNPHSGLLAFLRSELAHSFTYDRPVLFAKLDGQISGYLPTSRRTTLALSLRAGMIYHLISDSRTPSHKLFFLGGRNSVRGFSEENLIPSDLSPVCIIDDTTGGGRDCVSPGGNAYLVLKGEFRFPLFGDVLGGALFVDAGNLWVEPKNVNPLDLRPAAGAGLRLATPIGPLALDFGFNLMPDDARSEDKWNIHFNVGVY